MKMTSLTNKTLLKISDNLALLSLHHETCFAQTKFEPKSIKREA